MLPVCLKVNGSQSVYYLVLKDQSLEVIRGFSFSKKQEVNRG